MHSIADIDRCLSNDGGRHTRGAGTLLLRQRWSRLLSATLAFGWAALLGVKIGENLAPSKSSDTTSTLLAFGLMVLLLLFGSYLVSSRKARSFLVQ